MNIRTKVFIVLGGCILCLTGALHFIMSAETRKIADHIERLDLVEDVQRTRFALEQERNRLTTSVQDWAEWDDTYNFMQERSVEFIESNLIPSTFQTLDIDGMLFLDLSGRLFHSAGAAHSTAGLDSILESACRSDRDAADASQSRIFGIGERLLLVSCCRIVNSLRDLPFRGTLVFYRFVDEDLVVEIGKRVQREVSFLPFEAASLPEGVGSLDDLADQSSLLRESLSPDRIAGFASLAGANGEPVFLVRIEAQRSAREGMRKTQMMFIAGYIVVPIVMVLAIFLLVELLMLRPISRIDREVREIGQSASFSGRLTESGKDEFFRLSHAVNVMLEELDAANRKLLAAIEEVKALGGLLPICASCKRIRDDAGYWQQVEVYISEHSGVTFTHGLCPVCMKKYCLESDLDPDQVG